MSAVRMVGWEIRPVVMLDDGEHLTPLPVEPRTILAAQWDEFKNGGDERAVQHLRDQVAQQQAAESPDEG